MFNWWSFQQSRNKDNMFINIKLIQHCLFVLLLRTCTTFAAELSHWPLVTPSWLFSNWPKHFQNWSKCFSKLAQTFSKIGAKCFSKLAQNVFQNWPKMFFNNCYTIYILCSNWSILHSNFLRAYQQSSIITSFVTQCYWRPTYHTFKLSGKLTKVDCWPILLSKTKSKSQLQMSISWKLKLVWKNQVHHVKDLCKIQLLWKNCQGLRRMSRLFRKAPTETKSMIKRQWKKV